MIIADLYIVCISVFKTKTDSPLIIDANCILTFSITE